ncbi:TVP38/TMEM64 family protein [Oceanicella actignis]|uniref:TVP38/TMEM64 family protein n=1 Tax=Oceanicella actignis TaxID=1189325 RepID=UPI0011E8523D|nr:TVP38/TMEM64 family protein [Oceanicella actignis]TYO90832.1 putative membrane protein YdjX (TVP38/TMEM64 family) [Oceanicella actignis]
MASPADPPPTRAADPLRGAAHGALAPKAAPDQSAPDREPAAGSLVEGAASGARGRWRRLAPLAGLLAGGAAAWWFAGDLLSFEALRDNREALVAWRDANYALAAGVYMLIYVLAVAFSAPGGLALTLAGGFLFGMAAAPMIVVAATAGATLIFLAARHGLGGALEARARGSGGAMARLRAGIARNEISFLLLMRLVPVVPFFVANLAPAFLGVSLRNYVLTTLFGIIPGTVVYTWVGAGLAEVFARDEAPDLGVIFEPHVLGPLLALCALAAAPMLLRGRLGKDAR